MFEKPEKGRVVTITEEQRLSEAAAWFVESARRTRIDRAYASRVAGAPGRGEAPVAAAQIAAAAVDVLGGLVSTAVRHKGWTPVDLREIVRRRARRDDVALLADLVIAETARHPDERVVPRWRREVDDLGSSRPDDLRSPSGLASALRLAGALDHLPALPRTLPAPGSADASAADPSAVGSSASTARHTHRVRALLAKAESTDHPEEAEALSAKAQELVSRYALDRLLAEGGTPSAATLRRIWIDAPHVSAKALLVDRVARANGCRVALSETLGFASVVGAPSDVDAVGVMAVSLLAQAESAALACGARRDRDGTVRTASFRRSFLLAYAARVGERLAAASRGAAAADPRAADLVVVMSLRDRAAEEALVSIFGSLHERTTSVRSLDGWAAGRAAADTARFGGRDALGAAR
ncbi:uncharacterized protein DUF2786 [Mumia flava]|uniref:Uncharacterized protein DUF2786 n=1 Tax=Mumia flava TaxID=1348852 RepID=A0A2M9BIN4_9ACTN|nr:DUF2786 domain-containing protein [Mumia flava]PJJ57805.1 uncharacterized protein DUF2786 [Mumia flava]